MVSKLRCHWAKKARRTLSLLVMAGVLLSMATIVTAFAQRTALPDRESAGLVFRSSRDGEYTFDTGVLRGKLRGKDKSFGLTSLVHVPSGTPLAGGAGILSYYRIFTTNKRCGTAAWDWPSTATLLFDGSVQIAWPAAQDRPFEMTAVYRWAGPTTLDLETIVKPHEDLPKFEVFLASYFDTALARPYVCVRSEASPASKPRLLLVKKSFGTWQMFPRRKDVLPIIHDGRWKKDPHPVDWVIMPEMAAPLCVRRGTATEAAAILMARPGDCFAIATPYEGESHYSLYLSLFGRDIKAGRTARVHCRLIIGQGVSDEQILNLYRDYVSRWLEARPQSSPTR